AWVGDVLTFYQERVANESFLGTAVFRESVARLAALLDYVPAPGVAASTELVFELDSGKTAELPAGLRVQSAPRPGESAQTFETSAPLRASARLNAVRIFPGATAGSGITA